MNSEKGLDNLSPYHNFLEPIIYFFHTKTIVFVCFWARVYDQHASFIAILFQIKAFNEQQKCLHACLS